jgi:hypothetical protein
MFSSGSAAGLFISVNGAAAPRVMIEENRVKRVPKKDAIRPFSAWFYLISPNLGLIVTTWLTLGRCEQTYSKGAGP